MAKYDFDVAFAAATQTAEGTYNSTLDAISGTLTAANGLILGDPQSGIGESGLSLTVGRARREKAVVSGSYTRPLADFLRADVPTLTFAFPFCGNRATISGSPADSDFTPIAGVDAILEGAGMSGAASASTPTVGWRYAFGSPNPISILVYYFGNRIELLDCRVSRLAIDFTPGEIAIATADISVGSVKDPTAAAAVSALPTLTYGEQATVSAPVIDAVAHTWQAVRGFSSLNVSISSEIEEIPDSNAASGSVKESTGRTTTIDATMFADDASTNETYEVGQLFSTTTGELDQLQFQVGPSGTDTNPALGVLFVAPQPEVLSTTPVELGSKAGNTVSLQLGSDTANAELEIDFL